MELIKLAAVFVVLVVLLKLKLRLWQAFIVTVVATVLLWRIPFKQCFVLLWQATRSWENLSILLILYFITFLQRLLERREQLKLAQKDLDRLFHNRRITATLAPIFIGLLPSAAAAIICGDIVNATCGDDLSTEEKAFVTSYFRHIPESFLPTYSSVILMSGLCGVGIGGFILGMLPLEIILFLLGWLFYIRKLKKTAQAVPGEGGKPRALLDLVKHLWSLITIIILILVFNVPVWISILAVTVACWFVYRFKGREFLPIARNAVEPVLIVNSYLVLVFKEFLGYTGVINTLPETFSALPIAPSVIFALIFFFGTVIAGSTAIIAICTPMAFAAIPDGGMPLMVLLMSFSYAAMQISPTHVCLVMITEYFKTTLGGIIKKTIPVISVFMVITLLYYYALRMIR